MKKQRNFFPIFRIILCMLIFIFFSTEWIFTKNFQIETSRGLQIVSIPDGYTAEEAFLEMSKLYLEEKWDHEDLLEESKNLLLSIDSYKKKVDELEISYELVIADNKNLSDLYKKANRIRLVMPKLAIKGIYSIENEEFSGALLLGIELFEKVDIVTEIGYPFSIGLQIGISF